MSVDIRIESDFSEVDRDLARIARGPDRGAHLWFDQILASQFVEVEVAVHVQTGSLKASGRFEGWGTGFGGWRGEIRHGGLFGPPSNLVPGPPRNPGRYAIFEFERGGAHNWITASGIEQDEGRYSEAITDWMADG